MSKLKNKIALVTGASRGLGKGIAEELGCAGATVYVTGRSSAGNTTDNLPGTVSETADIVTECGGRGIAIRCDHRDDDQVEALFDRIRKESGKLDILVNNVWGGYEQYDIKTFGARFWDQPLERWSKMFNSGVRAHFTASRLAAPLMIPHKSGLIVNISAGDRGKYLWAMIYDLSKNAIDRMAYGMAQELKKFNIAAVSLYPGFTRTERVLSEYKGDLSVTESPRYTGRAVVALAADPDVMKKTGNVFPVGTLAEEYDFTDIDGRRIPPFTIDEVPGQDKE